MSVTIKLKGPWSPKGTDTDEAYSYYVDNNRIFVQDNDYGLNKRWYFRESVARIDEDR